MADPPQLKQDEIAHRAAAINSDQVEAQEPSKNALKKAAKQEKLAAEKANKSSSNSVKEAGKAEAKRAVNKAPKKKIDGAALIGIDVAKEDDFAAWYQQILTKGDMLDYYDVSGCYILKVICQVFDQKRIFLTVFSQPRISSGRGYKTGSTRRSRASESETVRSLCSCLKMFSSEKRIT